MMTTNNGRRIIRRKKCNKNNITLIHERQRIEDASIGPQLLSGLWIIITIFFIILPLVIVTAMTARIFHEHFQ